MKSFIVATSLIAILLPGIAVADTTGQPGRGGDGHCPIKELATDPDCAREGAQWRGSGRIGDTDDQAKSSRDEFPRCRNWETSEPRPAGCRRRASLMASAESDKRNQWPDRTPQPRHLG